MSATPTKKTMLKKSQRPDGSIRLTLTAKCGETDRRTEQSHKHECDIRNIVRRYAKMGQPLTAMPDPSTYQDLTSRPDYLQANIIVAKANQAFAELPSRVRARFQNDPSVFMEFMSDPSNADEGVKLGLFKKTPVPAAPTPSNPPKSPSNPPNPGKSPRSSKMAPNTSPPTSSAPTGDEGQA